jgi:hypothetical protein
VSEADAIGWLVSEVPELQPLLDEHLADNGELLPYLVFEGSFVRWLIERVGSGDEDAARRFVDAVEPLLTTDVEPPANDRVWNLAGVCFVENLQARERSPSDQPIVGTIRGWVGPNTSRAFEVIRG